MNMVGGRIGDAAGMTHWKTWLGVLVVLLFTAVSALGVVMTTFRSRHLLHELQKLEQERNQLQVEWGRLLLEQSSLVAQGRVEDAALGQLGMEVPAMDRIVVLNPHEQ